MFLHREQEDERFISLGEAQSILEISEPELDELVAQGKLPAYKIGDQVVRFRKDQVSELKASWRLGQEPSPEKTTARPVGVSRETADSGRVASDGLGGRIRDFWYFNDFYIIGTAIIAALVILIISSR